MILSQLLEMAAPKSVDSTIANMDVYQAVLLCQNAHEGGSHPAIFRPLPSQFKYHTVGIANTAYQVVSCQGEFRIVLGEKGGPLRAQTLLICISDDFYGHTAGHLAFRMATHSVGHNEEAEGQVLQETVFIFFPDLADVCPARGRDLQDSRSPRN